MASVLTGIVVDCRDAGRVAKFWSEVLGWPAVEDDGYWWISATGRPDAIPTIAFVPVPEPKTVKNRVHLDVNPTGVDQEEELQRLLALGARPTDIGQGSVPWVVLTDIEGNEFCLLKSRVDRP
jgi:predicted enzyme related to lactoylglutathione lyase